MCVAFQNAAIQGGGGRNATWQPTVTSGQCLKPAAEGTPCKSHERTEGTATCDGVDYDFTQILPPGGAEYFTMQTQVKDTIFFDMIGKGLNASVPGCAFQDGHTEANVGGLAVKQSDLCFSIGKVDNQKWYLNGTSSPLNQIISVVFSGGQDGVSTRLEMTCDPDQVEPFFPTTLPLQADPNVVVIPGRSKYACSNVPTRPPSIDNLPYCADSCSKDWDTCIAKDTAYTARQCLDFANKGFLCKTNGIPTQCDATGFLKKQPVCPGQMRFVSCISCRPSCQTPSPAGCGGACAPGCKCPPETPYWDDAVASCVRESDCPRTGDCDQAIVKNYLGMPIGDAFCPSRAQGAVCKPSCERNMCVPQPSFEGRDKYAAQSLRRAEKNGRVRGPQGGRRATRMVSPLHLGRAKFGRRSKFCVQRRQLGAYQPRVVPDWSWRVVRNRWPGMPCACFKPVHRRGQLHDCCARAMLHGG